MSVNKWLGNGFDWLKKNVFGEEGVELSCLCEKNTLLKKIDLLTSGGQHLTDRSHAVSARLYCERRNNLLRIGVKRYVFQIFPLPDNYVYEAVLSESSGKTKVIGSYKLKIFPRIFLWTWFFGFLVSLIFILVGSAEHLLHSPTSSNFATVGSLVLLAVAVLGFAFVFLFILRVIDRASRAALFSFFDQFECNRVDVPPV